MRSSPLAKRSKNDLKDFFDESNNILTRFGQSQRLIWERILYPERFSTFSAFICKTCNKKERDLCICLSCGNVFCKHDLLEHKCQLRYGVDINTQQLFKFTNNERTFIFNPQIDRLIFAAKFAVIDGLPISAKLESKNVIFPFPRVPLSFPSFQTCSFVSSVMNCIITNPVLQKFYLSYPLDVHHVSTPEEAVHVSLTKLFATMGDEASQYYNTFFAAVANLLPDMIRNDNPCAFYNELLRKLDKFYESNRIYSLKYISRIALTTNFSCDCCKHQQVLNEEVYALTISSASSAMYSSLAESIANGLMYQKKNNCPQCHVPTKASSLSIASLPQTVVVAAYQNGEEIAQKTEKILHVDQLLPEDSCERSSKYQLYAIIYKNRTSMKYVSCVKSQDRWYCCDDGNRREITENDVLDIPSTMLFYNKI